MFKLFFEEFKSSSKGIIFFIFFVLLFSFTFRNLLFNLSAGLIDWRDYSLMVWIMEQNVTKILGLTFNNYFDANIYFPHKLTLLFSDLLLPQSIISIPFFFLSNNLILIFNSDFIANFMLNYISLYLFWKQIFKNSLIAFLGSIFFIFSPFLHLELSHFQMLTFWPFFLSLYFLVKYEKLNKKKLLIFSGLFLAIQFLASVYLSVFLITLIVLYLSVNFFSLKFPNKFLISFFIIFGTFVIIDGLFIEKYYEVKQTYGIKRELKEYVTYSANLSDYIFTSNINSTIHNSFPVEKWNSSDKNFIGGHGSFPGLLIFFLAIISIFTISKNKYRLNFSILLDRQRAFFLSTAIIGLIFSLGPRLNFNGSYAHIPLPYTLALKTLPFMESIRAPSRWSFLFFLGMVYFALSTVSRIHNSRRVSYIFIVLLLAIFFLEYIPLDLKTEKDSYINGQYSKLKQICSKDKKVLLEIPVTHLDVPPNVAVGLTYITKVQLASTYHNCYLVNGYSGYDLPGNFILKDQLYQAMESNDTNQFVNILKKRGVQILKINEENLLQELRLKSGKFLQTLSQYQGIKKIDNNIFIIQ